MNASRSLCLACALSCLAALVAGPAPAQDGPPDEAVASRCATPPVIDGDLADAAWAAAAPIAGFVDAADRGKPFRATWAKALYDDKHLYLAFWCEEPNPDKIKATGKPDENVWMDDCIEIFARHTDEPGEFLQFIANTRDVHEDYMNLLSRSPGKAWNSQWITITRVGRDAWTMEARIPLAELGVRGEPLRGDFLWVRFGREIYSDHAPGDDRRPARFAMWPWAPSYSGPSGFARLNLGNRNLLRNTDLSGDRDSQGFPRPWSGGGDAARLFSADKQDGETVIRCDASQGVQALLQQGLRVRPGDAYRVRAEVRGDARAMLQVRVSVEGEKGTVPIARQAGPSTEWTPVEFDFTSAAADVGLSIRAAETAPGKAVFFRRLEVVRETSGVKPFFFTWKIPEPKPFHGLDALAARRYGVKPYELLAEKGMAGQERIVFPDSSTGVETWLLTRDRGNECHLYHNLVWCFSANGRWIEFGADRPEAAQPKHRRWAARTDGDAIVPLMTDGNNYHWSPTDGDTHYHDLRGDPGWLVTRNLATGETRRLANLGKWTRPWGIIARPAAWADRIVAVNPDGRTGFTVRLDGSDRKDVVFEPADGGKIEELYMSAGRPGVLFGKCPHLYRLEEDGGISVICKTQDRAAAGLRNTFRPGHNDTSRSDLYAASQDGTVTDQEGRVEKVYDPSVLRRLGGFMGCNGYASWGPSDDWFLMEDGLHFVKVWRDGRAYQFLGFHLATSLDYYSMAWGQVSPDGTKVVTKTTMFGNTDMMLMLASRPLPPANVRCEGDRLAWDPPRFRSEIRGYRVYGGPSGGPYRPLSPQPVSETTWRIPAGSPRAFVVTSVEHCGQEGPYSAEVHAGLTAAEPVRLFAEAELLELEGPVVERREAGASNWHYVAQDPYVRHKTRRDGRLAWKPRRLPDRTYALWARLRTTQAGRAGSANVLVGGKAAGKLTADAEAWTWVRAQGVSVRPGPAAQADIALVPEDGALAVDMLALTSNPDDKPSGRGNADQTPPAAPGGLTAAIVGAREISLAWQPSTDEDLLHYNVYASDRDTVAPEPRFLVGSPHQPKLVDWGLKTGTAYRYVVTARDRAGNEGPPSPQAVVAVPARPEALIRLEAEAARHEESDKTAPVLFLGEDARCSGGRYVECRVPGDDKTPLPERLKLPSGKGHLSWTFRVEKPGDYRLWLRLRSRQWSANLSFLLDGKPAGSTSARFGWWDARTQNMMWGEVDKAYTWFWTDIFAYRALDTRPLRFRLDAGEHVFTLADVAPGLDVDAVALTSDFAWIPEGLLNYF